MGGATGERNPEASQLGNIGWADARQPDRRSTEDTSPEEDIQLRFFQRVINDILKGKIDPDALRRLPDMQDKNAPPNLRYFQPVA